MVARLVEQAFLFLEAPIKRVNGYDIVVPYFAREQAYIPDAERIVRGARDVLRF
jgi:pyruvate/2-oxoglutarate/acetoin dehydrogenase E1 component